MRFESLDVTRHENQGLGRESSQRFWTFGPKRGPGPGQARQRSVRAVAGSEDPRKIDSTWHIPPGGENTSWNFLSLPGLCMPFGRKWARRIEWESNGDERGPACRGRGGRVPGNGQVYPIYQDLPTLVFRVDDVAVWTNFVGYVNVRSPFRVRPKVHTIDEVAAKDRQQHHWSAVAIRRRACGAWRTLHQALYQGDTVNVVEFLGF